MLDIEHLGTLGRRIETCPYYGVRANVGFSDFITLPYNMLIVPDVRKALGIDLTNKVVIFDEAHNVIDSVRGAYSLVLTEDRVIFVDLLDIFHDKSVAE